MFRIKRSKADALFSNYIRELAGWKCERCKKEFEKPNQGLHCSHYHSRAKKSVRFDPQNAASLCFACHQFFGGNPYDHTEFFKRKIGEDNFNKLAVRASIPQRVDEKIIVIWLKEEIKKLNENKKVLI